MKGTLFCFLAATGMLLHAAAVARDEPNQLLKIYYHQEQATGTANPYSIGLGKILLHFAQEPTMNSWHTSALQEGKELVLFFPKLKVSSAAQTMLDDFAQMKLPGYSVRVEKVLTPIEGVKFILSFDQAKIGYASDACDSIVTLANGKKEKCLELRFYNKELIRKINQEKTLTRYAQLKRPGIIIDCGHGGADHGAIGCFNLREKDVTMDVGLQVAQMLRSNGFEVFLTRDMDKTVRLDERTAFANSSKAGLFVSIHANFSRTPTTSGIETFCLDRSLFKPVLSNLDDASKDCIARVTHELYSRGNILANAIHQNLLEAASKRHTDVVDRKVKQQVAQVLVGNNLPSALVEIGFLSHQKEAQLLGDKEYQRLIAHGICKGIVAYCAALKAAA